MASTTNIDVHKASVSAYLASGKDQPFLIPEYQRPYAWGVDEATTLFDDLLDFAEREVDREKKEAVFKDGSYFLGSVVCFLNEDTGEREVIDGQQRLTSLMLLLRAIYTKLAAASTKTKQADNFMGQIEPCLWRKDRLTGEVDTTMTLMHSAAMDDEFNERLQLILDTGSVDEDWHDNYSTNYQLFQKLYEELCSDNSLLIYRFIDSVLNHAILLPIQANSQDTALTIFSTLNDRGKPLSDADIFKAKMYDNLEGDERHRFIVRWKEIESRALNAEESMQHLFYIYMFYLRAIEGDTKTTTPGARKYFSQEKFRRLHKPGVLAHISKILTLLEVAKQRMEIEDEAWTANGDIMKMFDMLSTYPNEWWQYSVATYYLAHGDEDEFEMSFLTFLRRLFCDLIRVYIVSPTVNSIKGGILKLNVACIRDAHPSFDFRQVSMDDDVWKAGVIPPRNKNTRRMILSPIAYDVSGQGELLPTKWEIEHIFPQHWQANYDCGGYTPEKLAEVIEEIGNLMPLEKPLNIGASDGYYAKKAEKYAQSSIALAQEMAFRTSWSVDDIHERNVRVVDQLKRIILRWCTEYDAS